MDYMWLALSGILGIGMHLLMKYRDCVTKKQAMVWKNHILNGAFSILAIAILLLFAKDIESVLPLTKLTMFFAGYMTDSVWKNFTKFGSKQLALE